MRKFRIKYDGPYGKVTTTFEASDHTVARRLGAKWLANRMGYCDADKVVVVDVDASGHGAHTGHCQGCRPYEMCSRSGTCGWCDERNIDEDMRIDAILSIDESTHPTSFEQRVAKKLLADRFLTGGKHAETTWARIQQEELDKVHSIWSRRSGDTR